jgi:hypothetical protein
MKIKCIIVEDEKLAAEKLASFIEKISVLELVSIFGDGILLTFLGKQSLGGVVLPFFFWPWRAPRPHESTMMQ